MRRRRFLLALGAGVSLAGCSSQNGEPSPPPTDEPPEETTTAGPPDGEEFYQYLLSPSDMGEEWEQVHQSSVPRYAQRELRNADTGRRLGVGVRILETVPDAVSRLEETLDAFVDEGEIDAGIGDVTYEAYPDVFDTGVLFRDGVHIGFAAVSAGEAETTTAIPETTTADGTTETTTGGTTDGTTAQPTTAEPAVTVEDAVGYAEQLHGKLPTGE